VKYALQRCCVTADSLRQYETSTDAVLRRLGIAVEDVDGFGCCGYPLKNVDHRAHVLASARNLALAERAGRDVLTLCDCCYGSLKHAAHSIGESRDLRDHVGSRLAGEGLQYTGRASVRHLFEVLLEDVGIETIRGRITRPLDGVRVAVHYGCHLLRPSRIVGFDDPRSPSTFDRLVAVTGAESVPWSRKLECCGSSMLGVDDALSATFADGKASSAREAGAQCVCVSCPFCHLQFDRVRHRHLAGRPDAEGVPAILFTQLLGLALGIDESALGLDRNKIGLRGIAAFGVARKG
jgi:heterodisulfide reductase subunit B